MRLSLDRSIRKWQGDQKKQVEVGKDHERDEDIIGKDQWSDNHSQYDFSIHWRRHFELHNNSKWQLKKERPCPQQESATKRAQ